MRLTVEILCVPNGSQVLLDGGRFVRLLALRAARKRRPDGAAKLAKPKRAAGGAQLLLLGLGPLVGLLAKLARRLLGPLQARPSAAHQRRRGGGLVLAPV